MNLTELTKKKLELYHELLSLPPDQLMDVDPILFWLRVLALSAPFLFIIWLIVKKH